MENYYTEIFKIAQRERENFRNLQAARPQAKFYAFFRRPSETGKPGEFQIATNNPNGHWFLANREQIQDHWSDTYLETWLMSLLRQLPVVPTES